MHRPYISGPMSGIRFHNFPAFFDAETKLRAFNYEPLNPARRGGESWVDCHEYAASNPKDWVDYIRADTELLLQADSVVLLEGWEESKGACFEIVVAVSIGIPIALYCENGSGSRLELRCIQESEAYALALKHLTTCGLGGVRVPC